jgi:RNA polymerase sigma-70 factor (ECF subfamily)
MTPSEFRQLFAEQVGFVWRVLERHGVPQRELEDGCQEVFFVVFRRLAEFQGRSSLKTWIYGIAVRVAVGMRRKAYRRRELLVDGPESATGAEPFDAVAENEARALLMAALAELPRTKREVFVLYELEELTVAEAAAALDVSENTALYRLYAARAAVSAFARRSELRKTAKLHAKQRTGS